MNRPHRIKLDRYFRPGLFVGLLFGAMSAGADVARMDPTVRATLARVDSLATSGAYDSALAVASRGADLALAQGDTAGAGRLLTAGAGAEMRLRGPEMAKRTLERAFAFARAVSDSGGWMNALGYLSVARGWQGDFDGSKRASRERLRMSRLTGDRESEAWALSSLAYLSLRLGQPDSARAGYRRAAELFAASDRVRAQTTALVGLGRASSDLGEYEAARGYYLEALERSVSTGDWRQQSDALNNLGTLAYRVGDIGKAAEYFEHALEINRTHDNARGTLIPASNIARARAYLGQFADAARILEDAIRMCNAFGFGDRIGMLETALGEVRSGQGRYAEAARRYRGVVNHKGATADQRDEAAVGLARSLERVGDDGEAERVYRDALTRQLLPEVVPQVHAGLARCLLRSGRADAAMTHAQAAVETARKHEPAIRLEALRVSGTVLAHVGAIAAARVAFESGMLVADTLHHASTEYEWREGGDYLGGLVDLGVSIWREDPSFAVQLFDQIEWIKARTLLERALAPRPHEADSLFAAMPRLDCRMLQRRVLEPGEVMVDFAVGRESGIGFALTRDTLVAWEVPGERSDFVQQIEILASVVGTRPDDITEAAPMLPALKVRHVLFGPGWPLIVRASRVIVAPDGYVAGVPMYLVCGAGTVAPVLVPSATFWAWRCGTGNAAGEDASDDGRPMLLVSPRSPSLRGVGREIAALSGSYQTVRVSNAETIRRVVSSQSWSAIHAAAHILVEGEHPWRSGIVMDDDAMSPALREAPVTENRDILRARDIAGMSIDADVAFLSGCESAMGRATAGEGVLGLSSAMLIAGSRAVVGTLWPVDDVASAVLAASFYEHLAAGETVSAALVSAQGEVRARTETSHPFFWGGYVVIGDGNVTVDVTRASSAGDSRTLIILGAAVVIAILVGMFRRRVIRKG